MRGRLCVALWALLGVGGTASCEAVWGSLSEPAAENCVLHANMCQANQICNPISQLCQDAVALSQVTPARARTSAQTPITITGENFVPGMTVKWNGTPLQPVTVDSATQLQVTAPMSADGAWRVTIEVSNPSGATASRSDLFSYSASEVTFQATVPSGPKTSFLFLLTAVPAAKTGRPTIVFSDSSQLHGITIGSDEQTVTEPVRVAAPASSSILAVGDLNGDGIRDLILGSNNGFFLVAGNPDTTFAQYTTLHLGVTAGSGLGIGDLDHDGHADLVGIDFGNKKLAILGNGGSQYTTVSAAGGAGVNDVAVAELDGLPGDDLAVMYEGTASRFGVIHGDSTLMPYADVSIPACNSGRVQAGRFGGGTNQALVITCQDRVQVMQATSGGAFTAGLSWPVESMKRVVGDRPLLADFDGDGDLDVVAMVRGTAMTAPPAELWLFDNVDGRGTLMARQLAASVAVSDLSIIDVGDPNDDGKPDVLVGDRRSGSAAPLTIVYNRSR